MRNLAQSCSVFTRDFSHIQLLTGLLKICVHCYFLWLVCTYVFPILAIIIEISSQELINWLCCQLCQVFCKLWSEKYSSVLLKGLFKSCKTKNNFWKPWQRIVAPTFPLIYSQFRWIDNFSAPLSPTWNHQKTTGFLIISGGIEVNWLDQICLILEVKFGDDAFVNFFL